LFLGYPSYAYLYFGKNNEIDGSNGCTINACSWKFVPNLESLDITYQDTSLLPGGQLTKLDLPDTDTADKLMFYEHQKQFRRTAPTYESFFDDYLGIKPHSLCIFSQYNINSFPSGQYIVIDLRDLYLQDQKLTELDRFYINLKFNNVLSPDGYQIGLITVAQKKVVLKPSGEHGIINAAGKQQIQG
jgi:hypothetical protein